MPQILSHGAGSPDARQELPDALDRNDREVRERRGLGRVA
jgi:hypothetical protein